MNVNITGVYDYTDLYDNIVLLQTLNDGLPFKYADLTTFTILSNDYEQFKINNNTNLSILNTDIDNLTTNLSILNTNIINNYVNNTTLSTLTTAIDNQFALTTTYVDDEILILKEYTDQEITNLRNEGYIQEAVTQLVAWATSDEGKRFRKKIWDRIKLKWLSFTGGRAFTELIDDISHATTDELDEMLKVYRYKDDPISGSTSIAGIRTDPFSGKEICMKGDTYIYSGNLFLTGDIHKGTFNITTGAWTEEKNLNNYFVMKGVQATHCLDINSASELLELYYDDLDFELGPTPTYNLKLKYPIRSIHPTQCLSINPTTKQLEFNINTEYLEFETNATHTIKPKLELKGVKTNNGLSIDTTTKLLQFNLNPDYFNINASNQLSPVLELKGVKSNNFLKVDATTKLLELTYNPFHFGIDGSNRLAFRMKTDGGLVESSSGSGVKLGDNSLSLSTSGLQVNIGSGLMTSINGVAIKLADTSLDVSTLGLQVSTTYKSELQQLKTDTETFKTQAQTAKTGADTAKTGADAAKTQALTAAGEAAASATTAGTAATTATTAATTASASAVEATTAAGTAGVAAGAAAASSGTAIGAAAAAGASAAAAAISATFFQKGDKGDTGATGPQGIQGIAGNPLSITWMSPLLFNSISNTASFDSTIINGHTTAISILNTSSSSLLNSININNTSISILNTSSTNLLNAININNTSISILNTSSTNLLNSININNTSISILNTSSTNLLNTINNKTNFSNLYISGASTLLSSLNVTGIITGNGTALTNINYSSILNPPNLTIYATNTNLNSISTQTYLDIPNIKTTSTTIFNNLNSLSTISILSINNKTNFSNLYVSGASTLLSSLNILGNIIGSGTALTNLNYNSILNPPTLPNFNNPCTLISTLFVSGNTILNNATTINTTLNISGYSLLNNVLELTSTAQSQARLILTGQEFYAPSNTSPNGIALLCGVNRTGNRQLWIADSANLIQNTTNSVLRLMNNSIDCIATNGINRLPFTIANGLYFDSSANITVLSTLNVVGNIIGSGTALTNLNYNSITNPPNLSSYLPLAGGTMTASLIMTGSSSAFFFGGGGGAALGEAGGAGAFSSSAATNDFILRSRTGNNLILQSGGNGGAIIIDSSNNTSIKGILTVSKDNWILSSDGILRVFFANNGTTYFHSGNTGSDGFKFRNFAQSDIFTITDAGNVSCTGSISNGSTSYMYAGGLRLNGTDTGNTIWNGNNNMGITVNSGYSIILGMNGGNGAILTATNTSVTISQPTTINNSLTFKTDVWNYSTEGYQRLYFGNAGITYYQGYGQYALDINHEWRNHQGNQKMRLDNSGNLRLQGSLQCNFLTIANTNRDLTGIAIENTSVNDFNNTVLYCIQGTFTGFHRVFTDDELFNIEEPQNFKNDYEGRIVISNGKTATDTTDNGIENNTEWEILYDKAGITIEDALPKIELSRIKKDKRVFGVLGDRRRRNNRPERLIVNSVGEGGLYVINSNSNIENGDYITSSDYLGYGEKQDDDILHNYTVAKATMSCDFVLDSPLYNCYEIEELDTNGNKLRVAFISVTYHCG